MCILRREAIPRERLDFYQTMLVYKILFYFPIKFFQHVVKFSKTARTYWLTAQSYQHSFYNWEKYLNHQRETSSNILGVCVDPVLIGCWAITWSDSPPIRVEITVDWRTSHLQSWGGRDRDNMLTCDHSHHSHHSHHWHQACCGDLQDVSLRVPRSGGLTPHSHSGHPRRCCGGKNFSHQQILLGHF